MTQSYRDNKTRSSSNNRSNGYRGYDQRKDSGKNQASKPGMTLFQDDWKKETKAQIHWKPVLIVLTTVFAVGALVGGLTFGSASKDAKTESTVLFCQDGGLLGISCH